MKKQAPSKNETVEGDPKRPDVGGSARVGRLSGLLRLQGGGVSSNWKVAGGFNSKTGRGGSALSNDKHVGGCWLFGRLLMMLLWRIRR